MGPVDKTSEEADTREPPSPRERPSSNLVIKIKVEEAQGVHKATGVEQAVEAEERQDAQSSDIRTNPVNTASQVRPPRRGQTSHDNAKPPNYTAACINLNIWTEDDSELRTLYWVYRNELLHNHKKILIAELKGLSREGPGRGFVQDYLDKVEMLIRRDEVSPDNERGQVLTEDWRSII